MIFDFDFENAVKSGVEQAMRECELTIGMTLKEAVEKQIPKKPIRDTKQWATCPACGGVVSKSNIWEHIVEKEATFCEHCGQALDWGGMQNDGN